jgi:hypothetical protein
MNAMESYQNRLESIRKSLQATEDLYPKIARLDKTLTTIGRFTEGRTMMFSEQILVCVKVDKIADIEPVLETIGEELGIEFDRSNDYAEAGWRSFNSKDAPWLRVDAELRSDGPECRRVIVGYEQKPVYEIKCGDEAATPDATPPSTQE